MAPSCHHLVVQRNRNGNGNRASYSAALLGAMANAARRRRTAGQYLHLQRSATIRRLWHRRGYLVSWFVPGSGNGSGGVSWPASPLNGSRNRKRVPAQMPMYGGHQANNAALTGSGVAVTADGGARAVWNSGWISKSSSGLFPSCAAADHRKRRCQPSCCSPLSVALTGNRP